MDHERGNRQLDSRNLHWREKLSNLRYADDTILLTESEEELIQLIKIIERVCKEAGLHINRAKTKVMVIDLAKTALRPGNHYHR